MENKYSQGKIYKIKNTLNDKLYVGSTIQNLDERLRMHFKNAMTNPESNSEWYLFLRENGKDVLIIEEIEKYPCNSEKELFIREQYWMNELQPEFNIKSAFLTEEEKKTYNIEYCRNYASEHKEESKDRNKIYREKNKDQIYLRNKKYAEQNPEKVKEWSKKSQKKYKEKLKNRLCKCDICDVEIRTDSLKRHQLSKMHIKNIEVQI